MAKTQPRAQGSPQRATPGSPKPATTSVGRQHEVNRSVRAAREASSPQPRPDRNPAPRSAMPANVGTVRVMATAIGYYDHTRRRIGDVFNISAKRYPAVYPRLYADGGKPHPEAGEPHPKAGDLIDFSDRWMQLVNAATPERVTTANQAIRQHHDELIKLRNDATPPGPGATPDDIISATGNAHAIDDEE
jgi:hypothetical protein